MKLSCLLFLLSATVLAGRVDAQNNFGATLDEAQFVPPQLGPTGAHGSGTFVIDPNANTLSFDILAFVAVSPEESAHIHVAQVGQVGPSVFTLPLGTHKVGVWNYPESLEPSIYQGLIYVDVHTLEGPGSIRGQLVHGVPALPPEGLVVLVALTLAGGVILLRRGR